MIHTCSTYAKNHNLSFSTHNNPRKSKTKCKALWKKKPNLKKLALDDKKLPMVNIVKHFGTTLTDVLDDISQDILEESAQYIAKNKFVGLIFLSLPITRENHVS